MLPGETAAPGTTAGKTGTPSGQTAGAAFTVIVNAADANWNVVAGATPTVNFTSTDGQAVLPPATALVAGTTTFTNGVTLKTASSTTTITASDLAASLTNSTSPAVAVSAGSLDHFDVLAAGGGSITTKGSDQPFNIQVTAREPERRNRGGVLPVAAANSRVSPTTVPVCLTWMV